MNFFTKLFFLGFLILFLTSQLSANVYSSQLNFTNPDGSPFDGSFSDGTGGLFSFFLNDTASSVIIQVKDVSDNSVVKIIEAGAMSSGKNLISWDGNGTSNGKSYYYEITTEQPSYSNSIWTKFYDSGDINIYSRGGDMVTDMKSDLFGLIVAPNNGGPLGKGITIYNPDGSFHDPFLIAQDISEGGSVDWGTQTENIVGGFFDDLGRFYVSAFTKGELRRLDGGGSLTTVAGNLTFPKGVFVSGTSSKRTIYICSGNQIIKMVIGDDDTFSGFADVVANFSTGYPKDVALDDEGNLYTCLRTDDEDLNSDGAGIFKFSLSGTLPVTESDALWQIGADETHKVSELQFDYGKDRNSNSDDILYYCTRADAGNNDDGIWKVDDINALFATASPIITEIELYGGDDNINARAGLILDPAGNLILLENANEHIFFISPPDSESTNSFTTTGRDTIKLGNSTAVTDKNIPGDFELYQNYPNPFNPSTTIDFDLSSEATVNLKVFNSLGQVVAILLDNTKKSQGAHSVVFNASGLPSGTYIYRLQVNDKILTNKMILLK